MSRWLLLACALIVGAAAPVRAWCEATCLAPTAEKPSHCPAQQPADGAATISASIIDECPVLESARPNVAARLDLQAALVRAYLPSLIVRTHITPSFDCSPNPATVFERCTPLRI
jgi:hypothetical protein